MRTRPMLAGVFTSDVGWSVRWHWPCSAAAALELIHEAYGGPPATIHREDHTGGGYTSSSGGSGSSSGGSGSSSGGSGGGSGSSSGSTGSAGAVSTLEDSLKMHMPLGPDLRENAGAFAAQAAAWGLEELPRMAEVYPLGGAGDRLGLVDEATGESLPAALLPYNGRTLIEGLLRDLAGGLFPTRTPPTVNVLLLTSTSSARRL